MGLLDDLEVPAEAVHRRDQDAVGFGMNARAPMRDAFMFFTNFVRDISKQPPRILASYTLEEFGSLLDLKQAAYQLDAPLNLGNIQNFTVRFECEREGELNVPTDGSRVFIEQRSEYLRKHGMKFSFEEMYKDVWGHTRGDHMQGAFSIQRYVPVSFRFEVDEAAQRIVLIIRNLSNIGQERLPIKLETMSEAFYAEVAKAMLRKPNRMNELAGFKVQDDMRAKLRARLEKEAMLKQQQLAQNQATAKPSFFGNLFGKRKD